ncbi:2-isopropylmalate synthase [Candidatus Adlerbacteria bacterium RIFCSPHIGHO2_12_FULL_53_18]|uniref:2-isopropylmalate synthase n=2 Tax=Parcubacteria group TaxID=1794811 RepID=A0A1F4XTA3_9BACT|nr:MAG: 2-isopropylmalate synthase [Candidatus Adlerbacteria bacterium RIFCSPHIGHO2_12_FULL_53_18]OGG49917.1 MAG: 2-isopropylmalate synthase [Candidatus Kaiserbacteria bacterium RIFCSPHIGHO2_01_FULL_54_36b]
MTTMPFNQYRPFPTVQLPDRTWPNGRLAKAPIWCAVDLRDGNQALIEPMGVEKKLQMFNLLVKIGFKEIEVGFPASSEIEFTFVRTLIEENRIPDDVTIQVLTQSREELIQRTFEALKGVPRAIVHLYNSTSELQRRVVFCQSEEGIIQIALSGARLIKKLAEKQPKTKWTFEYSPESFTGTEVKFACEICNQVLDIWKPTLENKAIINLPATVEMSTPNKYADAIEWMGRHLSHRDSIVLSLHTHNDRGCAVAATELGLLAGADRVEGTLFGNGERTGNADLVTLALNLMTQGIDPKVDLSDLPGAVRIAEECTRIEVHPRHPYAGLLALTAFSGSHQDAINKGTRAMEISNSPIFEVPYLAFNPAHVGREYRPVRVNSQSGKGGVAYIMRDVYGVELPRPLLVDFATFVQKAAEETGGELLPERVRQLFEEVYVNVAHPIELIDHYSVPGKVKGGRVLEATIKINGDSRFIAGDGNGELNAFANALATSCNIEVSLLDYQERSIGGGSDAKAIAYVAIAVPGREAVWGVGINTDIPTASLLALASAVNRSRRT